MSERKKPRGRIGVVVSDSMDKTVVVKVQRLVKHSRYNRLIKKSRSHKAHDEHNCAHVGDRVRIVETRPISKGKNWRVVGILGAAGDRAGSTGTAE